MFCLTRLHLSISSIWGGTCLTVAKSLLKPLQRIEGKLKKKNQIKEKKEKEKQPT